MQQNKLQRERTLLAFAARDDRRSQHRPAVKFSAAKCQQRSRATVGLTDAVVSRYFPPQTSCLEFSLSLLYNKTYFPANGYRWPQSIVMIGEVITVRQCSFQALNTNSVAGLRLA